LNFKARLYIKLSGCIQTIATFYIMFIIRLNHPILSTESSRLLGRKQPDYLIMLLQQNSGRCCFELNELCFSVAFDPITLLYKLFFQKLVCLNYYLTSVLVRS
jgi:hypothetical protein